jgi:hypothetical protein
MTKQETKVAVMSRSTFQGPGSRFVFERRRSLQSSEFTVRSWKPLQNFVTATPASHIGHELAG